MIACRKLTKEENEQAEGIERFERLIKEDEEKAYQAKCAELRDGFARARAGYDCCGKKI